MHDHIRDLGRATVVAEDVKNPGNRSIVWSNVDAVNLLKIGKGTDRVEIVRVDMGKEYMVTDKDLNRLKGVRYLDIACGRLTGDFSEILPNVRWIRLESHGPIPANLNMRKCVILDLLDSHVSSGWRGWKGIKAAGKLKVLKLRGCSYMNKFPDLCSCGGVEVLQFTDCIRMRGHLPICNFRNLKSLVLDDTRITELRGDIGLLQNLHEIVLKDCEFRETPSGISKSSSLEILDFTTYRKVPLKVREDIPTSIKRLSISSCPIDINLLQLQQLEELHYSKCRETEIPADLWKLPKLETLTLNFCTVSTLLMQLESGLDLSPALPSSLRRLDVNCCYFMETLPNLANLSNLTELRLENVSVCEILGLGELKMLATLQLCDTQYMKNLDGLENLVQLTVLAVRRCGIVGKFPDVSNLTKLKSLTIIWCYRLTEIQGLAGLKDSLTFLEIQAPGCLKVEGLESLESLEVLSLERCGGSTKLLPPSLSQFCKLQELTYKEIWYLPDQMSTQQLPDLPINIKVLKINCQSINKLPDLSRLIHLEKLNVRGCIGLTEIRGLERLDSLQKLVISNCYFMKELNLTGAKNLQILKALKCARLEKGTWHRGARVATSAGS